MKNFMSLVIKIALMQIQPGQSNEQQLLAKMYNSFFPTKGNFWHQNGETLEGQHGEFDPNDEQSEDFGPRIERLVFKLLDYDE